MPNKYPHLKSTTEPYGLFEQLAVAVTISPEEDGALDPAYSWFGRLLYAGQFHWEYKDPAGQTLTEFQDRVEMAKAYFSGNFRYTAYDCEYRIWNIDDSKGKVEGLVDIKGKVDASGQTLEHLGKHSFTYKIIKDDQGKWKLVEWVLQKQADGDNNPVFTVF